MALFNEFMSDKLINALGWSLFHTLWQGFSIALLLALLLALLKKRSSQLKYVLSFCSLLILLTLSIYNFKANYKDDANKPPKKETSLAVKEKTDFEIVELDQVDKHFLSNLNLASIKKTIEKLDKYFPYIVNIWLIGIFIFSIKFILAYLYTNKLKKNKIIPLSPKWINIFQEIEKKLQVKKGIKYMGSKLVKVPFVLGYFRPVVIIPIEMLTGMPANQIEAIIAHEIAHIRRNDYILNVLQTLIETVFFFHPAVWYISSQIRKERENCCDDLALTVCEESLVYAKALVSVQELTFNRLYSAVAFSGKKKHLLNRIKRMIMKPQVKSNLSDRILAAIIILSGVLAMSFTYAAKTSNYAIEEDIRESIVKVPVQPEIVKELPSMPMIPAAPVVRDTIIVKKHNHDEIDIDGNTVTRIYKDGKDKKTKIKFTLINGKVTDLYVDDKEIADKDYDEYQDEIDETIEELKDAKEDIRKAIVEVEEIDFEEIQMEVQEALKNAHVDVAEMHKEVARAMEEMHEINIEDIMKEVEASISHIKDLDFDFDFDFDMGDIHIDMEDISVEMEKAREAIKENINMEEIEKELMRVQEELSNMNEEEIRVRVEEGLEDFQKHNKEEVIEHLEQKLEELEKLELEEK